MFWQETSLRAGGVRGGGSRTPAPNTSRLLNYSLNCFLNSLELHNTLVSPSTAVWDWSTHPCTLLYPPLLWRNWWSCTATPWCYRTPTSTIHCLLTHSANSWHSTQYPNTQHYFLIRQIASWHFSQYNRHSALLHDFLFYLLALHTISSHLTLTWGTSNYLLAPYTTSCHPTLPPATQHYLLPPTDIVSYLQSQPPLHQHWTWIYRLKYIRLQKR